MAQFFLLTPKLIHSGIVELGFSHEFKQEVDKGNGQILELLLVGMSLRREKRGDRHHSLINARKEKRGRTGTLPLVHSRAEPTAPYRFLMSLAMLRNMSMLLSDVRRCPVASLVLKDGGVDDVDWDDPETVESRCTG
jgi:hypothetical protein